MLVLARRKLESIIIGDGIIVTVVEIRSDHVRIGIDAPKEIPVNRREVHDAIHRAAANGTLSPLRDKLDHEENQ